MATRSPSIRRALLARLMAPLLLLVILSGASAFALAHHFSESVLDHWLYDSAISLANRVKWENGRASVDLPEGAREILEWDVVDRVFYEVTAGHGERLIGNAFLPDPPAARVSSPAVYYAGHVSGAAVRVLAVSLKAPEGNPVIVKVAETMLKRNELARQVLWISVGVSILLTLISAAVIWYGIGAGTASMEKAVRDVRSRHAAAPLAPITLDGTLPQEVFPLVQEINDLIETLSGAHRLNQRFIADAAHQLRTPVATLRVQLELALREQDAVRHANAINDAVLALTRMGHTLHQLLTLAKADSNESGVTQALVDIDLIARQEVEKRIDDALFAGVDLGYAGAGEPVWAHGQEELLREAVANLLDNALRYGAGGRHITVGVSAASPEIYVEDTGPGIPESERDKVRQRFYRMPGTHGDGCGLGLSIVEEIVRRHAGSLVLETGAGGSGLRARFIFQDLAPA